jgi:hypothetical protein
VADGVAAVDLAAADLAAAVALARGLAGGEVDALARGLAGGEVDAVAGGEVDAVAEGWVRAAGAFWFLAGLNVATESIAPATRQTARMLASSGIIVPCPASGPASRRSRRRRRLARSSRW